MVNFDKIIKGLEEWETYLYSLREDYVKFTPGWEMYTERIRKAIKTRNNVEHVKIHGCRLDCTLDKD